MPRTLLLAPTGHNVGLTSVTIGLLRAFERRGVRLGYLKPVAQTTGADRSVAIVRTATAIKVPDPVPRDQAETLLGHGEEQILMERVVDLHRLALRGADAARSGDPARLADAGRSVDLVVTEGMVPAADLMYSARVNAAVAKALDADVVLVATAEGQSPAEVAEETEIAARTFPGRVSGCILNRFQAPGETYQSVTPGGERPVVESEHSLVKPWIDAFRAVGIPLVGVIPFRDSLAHPRLRDLAEAIGAQTLIAGSPDRRVARTRLLARTVTHAIDALTGGTLIVTPGDRDDLIMAVALATKSGIDLAGLLLTGDLLPDPKIMRLCEGAWRMGLPVLLTAKDSFATVTAINAMDPQIPTDDRQRIDRTMDLVANNLDSAWIAGQVKHQREARMTPPAFRCLLIEKARALAKRIVLPEGDEPRTLAAAAICAERGIARCILLGDPERIHAAAKAHNVRLPEGVQILDARSHIERLTAPMVELRKAKGLTPDQAREQLEDTVVLGTMMLKLGEVDGLVSGAIHTTANTIRPALQLIKLKPGMKLASSVFFMCLPDQVVVYGDCAVNPDPTAEELADIAIQSADSAAAFDIPPRVAMISYSTGTSGAGADVEKVAAAVKLARERRPELNIDGPLQYDAACMPDVAKSKAPNSTVAGRATVYVFPDLNTGNTTYKAVQRSTGCISIGPMMQGMGKPVNDLSRGALVEDIVFTIALTAIQAGA